MESSNSSTESQKAKAKLKIPRMNDPQANVLKFVVDYIDDDPLDRSPVIRKIAPACEIARSTVWHHLEALRDKMLLSKNLSINNLEPTDLGREAVRLMNQAETSKAG